MSIFHNVSKEISYAGWELYKQCLECKGIDKPYDIFGNKYKVCYECGSTKSKTVSAQECTRTIQEVGLFQKHIGERWYRIRHGKKIIETKKERW